jgi:transposase
MAVTTTVADCRVFGGVDTHKDVHVAACLDKNGGLLGTERFPVTPEGYQALLDWMQSAGSIDRVGVEGTGSWGAGLSRFLQRSGVAVIEVNRPNRQNRRLRGKSDTIDAIAAARAVLNGQATAIAKTADGDVETMRMLRVALRSGVNARTQTANQIHSLIDSCPMQLREELQDLGMKQLCARAKRFRPSTGSIDPTTSAKRTLRHLAKRWIALTKETDELREELHTVVAAHHQYLLDVYGVGPDVASALLIAVGDNPERCATEAAFAALCGVSPMDASSGKQQRHRLNRGGNRSANNALWRIAMIRIQRDPKTQAYMERKLSEGKTKREAIRCLKRTIARQLWRSIVPPEIRCKQLDKG